MTRPAAPDEQGSPTRPYLVRALHDWCTDNGFTPFVAVHVDGSVQVPMEYVKNNEIVLNVGFEATSGLKLGNEFIEFKARFGGQSRDICVPLSHVVAIYARENGQGMAFPVPNAAATGGAPAAAATTAEPARRGLRLARTDVPTDEGSVALSAPPAPRAGWSDEQAPQPPQSPPPSHPPAGNRPSLKRIK